MARKSDFVPTVHNASTYNNHGCRCDVCRAAAVADRRDRVRRARERQLAVEAAGGRYIVEGITHGESGYRHHRCTCDTCRTGHAAAVSRRARAAAARRKEAS